MNAKSLRVTPEMIAAAEGVDDLYRMGQPQLWARVFRAMYAAMPSTSAEQAPAVQEGFSPAGWFYRTSEFGPWRECKPGQEGSQLLYLPTASHPAPAQTGEQTK